MRTNSHEAACVVIVVDRNARSVSLRVAADRDTLRRMLDEVFPAVDESMTIDLESVLVDEI
ncbi:MAG: hypothetical protein JWN71_493 [Xanthobacteraceae bacterium]|jgi:hypothetical protein|nr:hypothetical protein [Xanthobacteraceae bacterium]